MPKGLPSISSRTRLTMMLGEVPTSVISPPSSAANDIGIRKTEGGVLRSEEHTSELQSLMRISYAVFCLKKKKQNEYQPHNTNIKQNVSNNTITTKSHYD